MALGVAACNRPAKNKMTADSTARRPEQAGQAISPCLLIAPGRSIGRIKLGGNADSLINLLGKPDLQDAAMGASMMTWFEGHDTSAYRVTVYAHHNFGAKDEAVSHIKQIRITSPAYQTAERLHTGSNLNDIATQYHLTAHRSNNGKDSIYDDNRAGIAFEINSSGKCAAIRVHLPGDSLSAYLNML